MVDETGLDAILSAFICYSEFSSIKYDVKSDTIKIEVPLNAGIDKDQLRKFITGYLQSMELFHKITGVEPAKFDLDFIEKSRIIILRLYRDSKTLREQELELFVQFLRQSFACSLIRDDNDISAMAGSLGDVKTSLLQRIKQSYDSYHSIFAYRDEGRVFVFNK